MRAPRDTDFFIELPDIGSFRYARRTFGDRAAIIGAMAGPASDRVSGDQVRAGLRGILAETDDDGLRDAIREYADTLPTRDATQESYLGVIAAHKVLCVEAPPGWEDLAALDITAHPEWVNKAFELYSLLRGREDSFRVRKETPGEATGA